MNRKPVIGILPTSNYMMTNDTFADTYRFGNNYIKKIVENGGVPLLIPLCDEKVILETLEMCDGLLLPGGNRVRPFHFEIIDYFYQHRKPILGICLGMQALAMYSVNIENKEPKIILKRIDNGVDHWPVEITRANNEQLVHKDKVAEGTKLFSIFGKEEIEVNSVHKSTVTEVGSSFLVSIRSFDGLIEALNMVEMIDLLLEYNFIPKFFLSFIHFFLFLFRNVKKKITIVDFFFC